MPLESDASVQKDTLSYMSKYRNPRHSARSKLLCPDVSARLASGRTAGLRATSCRLRVTSSRLRVTSCREDYSISEEKLRNTLPYDATAMTTKMWQITLGSTEIFGLRGHLQAQAQTTPTVAATMAKTMADKIPHAPVQVANSS